MSGRRIALFVCLMLLALPLLAHEKKVILVLVDHENNRAYIPEGTVLPAHVTMNVRAERRVLDASEVAQLRADRDGGRGVARAPRLEKAAMARLKTKAPLVLQYLPEARFADARRNYEAQQAKLPRSPVQADSHMQCFDTYVSNYASGLQWTYYNGFTSTFCQSAHGISVGYSNPWEFRATGDYSDVDSTISPFVYVDDQNNNFQCMDYFAWPGDGSCSTANNTVLLQQGCLNDVDTGSQQYVIEYGNNYEPYYVGWGFLVDYCTYFY